MQEITGNLWDYHQQGQWIVITTNGFVKTNGHGVMGRGTAQQAAKRYRTLPHLLGKHITEFGNTPTAFPQFKILTLPVKRNWWEIANTTLISRSLILLGSLVTALKIDAVYMPRPGCGNGQLDWADVRPLVAHLDHRYTVIQL